MAIITLTSDWGVRDHYAAAARGAFLGIDHSLVIAEITHSVPPFDYVQASFVLKNAYPHFPPGTIHLIAVNPDLDNDILPLAVMADGHFFIGADNGIFSLVLDMEVDKIIEIDATRFVPTGVSHDSPVLNIFIGAACHLAKGGNIKELGKERPLNLGFWERKIGTPAYSADHITGTVVYSDNYGNATTNISKALIEKVAQGRKFRIMISAAGIVVHSVSTSYGQVEKGEPVALFNRRGMLKLAINKGPLTSIGIKQGSNINIDFP